MLEPEAPPRVVPAVGARYKPPGRIVRALEPFLKLPVEPPRVPEGAHDARVFRAAPNYLKYRYLMLWLGTLVEAHILIAIVGSAFAANAVVGILALILGGAVLLAILLFMCAAVRLDYDLRQYVVTDRALRTRTGAIVVSEATITFANVQDVEISQGPVQRWLGIADVIVHTAGGGGHVKHERGGGVIHRGAFVGIDRPQEVRDFVLERIKAFRDAGLGDPDDPTRKHPQPGAQAPSTIEAALDELRFAAAEFRGAAASRA